MLVAASIPSPGCIACCLISKPRIRAGGRGGGIGELQNTEGGDQPRNVGGLRNGCSDDESNAPTLVNAISFNRI